MRKAVLTLALVLCFVATNLIAGAVQAGDYILHTDDGVNFRLVPAGAPTPSPTVTPSPTPAGTTFSATFSGLGADKVGPGNNLTPDGHPDWVIHLSGLKSPPTRIVISEGVGSKWETPVNVNYWNLLAIVTVPTAELYFAPATPITGAFRVAVTYADGTTAAALTQAASPSPTATPAPSVSPTPTPMPPAAGGKELSLIWTEPSDTSVTGYMALIGNASRDYSIAQDMGKKANGKINLPGAGKSYVALASYNAAGDYGKPSDELVCEVAP